MAHVLALTGIEPTDPTYLYVHTDDDELVIELETISYRSADAVTKALILGWEQYEPEGDPVPAKDIALFQEWLTATYGTQTYMLRMIR